MKHLFVARHGTDFCGALDSVGEREVERLADNVKNILNGGSSYIISSTAQRALESSEILKSKLGLTEDFEREPRLWTGDNSSIPHNKKFDFDLKGLMGLVGERENRADGLIVMTHYEVVQEFPMYFLQERFGEKQYIARPNKGRAVHFDLETRTYKEIPPKE